MITIAQVVEEIVERQPFMEEAMGKNLINLSAFARILKPEIEERLYKSIEVGAIVMALKRFKISKNKKIDPKNIFTNQPDLITRSNLVGFTVVNSDKLLDTLKPIITHGKLTHKQFFAFTQGVFETSIICSHESEDFVKEKLEKETIIGKKNNLSTITIILPKENVVTPGVYYYILKILAWEGINVIDVISTENEFTIVFEDKDIDRSFSLLKKHLKT